MASDSNQRLSTPGDGFQRPSYPKVHSQEESGPQVNARLLKPSSSIIQNVPTQAGCSTIRSGGFRNKVVLKPGHSAMDWAILSSTKGAKGSLIAGINKLVSDPEIQRINTPSALMCLQHGVPTSKIYPPLKISMKHLEQHNSRDDCWCVLQNKVYCITGYMDFHPGGVDILLKSAAGKDATAMFSKYHRWVNFERLLESSYIGNVVK
ncbi:LADA_0G12002g1_1 [Lachancea dasiensis]|uniref:LADA_0G12002g1_1 n=1 Tax=Lachancea dasiensis TaxID=1072105 RepID=A0A1G4JVC2_9SACH|nr:LADA_0G12002g1_1 [Lachancea dasiensis]